MKLAEALQERADLNRKIEELGARLRNNCLTQEGEKPEEDPVALLTELDACVRRLEKLMAGINLANCATGIDGRTLTELIAEKDSLNVKLSHYKNVIHTASQKTQRATRSEIRILSCVDVSDLQKQADAMARRLRELDNTLQQCNWTTDVEI